MIWNLQHPMQTGVDFYLTDNSYRKMNLMGFSLATDFIRRQPD